MRALVCHDLSDFADRGLAALQALELRATDLHVVCVLPRVDPAHPGVVWPADEDELRREHARRALEARLPRHAQVHVRIGEPGARIVEVAREMGAQLIALSTHGRTGLRRLVEGSVAEHVARFAPCPVLVVPPGADAPPVDPPVAEVASNGSLDEQVDALAVEVCDAVESGAGWLTSITLRLPPEVDADDWIRRLDARLAAAGIDNVDVLLVRARGPIALLHTRFEEA